MFPKLDHELGSNNCIPCQTMTHEMCFTAFSSYAQEMATTLKYTNLPVGRVI